MASAPPPTPAPRGPRRKAIVPNIELLSAEEQADLRAEAIAAVEAEKKDVARKAYKEAAIDEARRATGLEDDLVTFTLDLAEYADRLVIDDVIYFHGKSYTVPRGKYDLMRDMAFRTWGHQMEIDGKKKSTIQPKNLQMGPHGIVNTTTNIMRV